MEQAAFTGNLEEIKRLCNLGEPCTPWTMCVAANYGHLHVVKWLHAHGLEGCDLAIWFAASNGQLEIVKWMYEKVCLKGILYTPDSMHHAMNQAALNGHLHVVKWLYEKIRLGFRGDYTKDAMKLAIEHNQLKVVEWFQNSINRVYYKAWLAIRGKKILWNFRLKRKFHINEAIRARPLVC